MRQTTAAVMTAAAAVLATGVGLGTASASSAAPAAPAAASGTEHFYLMSTSTTSNHLNLIAAGVFTGAGIDISGNTVDTVRLPGGTFKIHHSGGNGPAPKVNPTTCFATFSLPSPFTVSGGTGKYKHLTGSGKAVITIVGILARTHGHCNFNVAPVAQQETIVATGKVHL
jgi:hypothetical protein